MICFLHLEWMHDFCEFPWRWYNLKTWTQRMECFPQQIGSLQGVLSHQQFHCLQIQTTPWESKFALRSLRASMSCQSFSSTINTITRKKTWKLIRKYFTAKSRVDIGSASLELIVKPRHISKADILKECYLDLSQLTL